MKLRLYVLFGNEKNIAPVRGDLINEINFMKQMSHFFDIYYNNQKIDWSKPRFGLNNTRINRPAKNYDAYYVRNNPNIFMKTPKDKLKLYFATPYHKGCFNYCDYIITLTESWEHLLKIKHTAWGSLYPKDMTINTKKVITIHQCVDEKIFFPIINPTKTCFTSYKISTQSITKQLENKFIIVHFGRVVKSCYPSFFLAVYKQLPKHIQDKIQVVFVGSIKYKENEDDFKNIINIPNVSYNNINNLINASDLLLYNQRDRQAHYCGSSKIIEAIMCRKPILSPRCLSRENELGKNYPLFYTLKNLDYSHSIGAYVDEDNQSEIKRVAKLLESLINDPQLYSQIANYMKIIDTAKFSVNTPHPNIIKQLLTKFENNV